MNFLNVQTGIVLLCLATGCGKQGVVDPGVTTPNTQAPIANNVQAPPSDPVEDTSGVDVTITVYAKTASEAPVNGWITKTYTATGYCTQYQSNTYCWDDGIKTLQWTSNNNQYGPYTYTFWNMSLNAVGWSTAHGGLQQDLMRIPRLVDHTLSINMLNPLATPAQVLSTGSATSYDCTDTDGVVDCGNFVIDTTQAGL